MSTDAQSPSHRQRPASRVRGEASPPPNRAPSHVLACRCRAAARPAGPAPMTMARPRATFFSGRDGSGEFARNSCTCCSTPWQHQLPTKLSWRSERPALLLQVISQGNAAAHVQLYQECHGRACTRLVLDERLARRHVFTSLLRQLLADHLLCCHLQYAISLMQQDTLTPLVFSMPTMHGRSYCSWNISVCSTMRIR